VASAAVWVIEDGQLAMARKRGNSHGRLDEVIEAAARVFFEKGFEAATIQDIADDVGLLKGSLYYYIPNKQDALYQIIRSYHQETRAYFEPILASDDPVEVKLRRFIETETAHTAHHLIKSSLFFTEWRSLPPERRDEIVAERDRHDHFVQQCIADGQKQGLFRKEIDVRVASFGILGMVNSVYRWFDEAGTSTAEQIGAQFADLVINGLKPGT
jgi:AcrR family transcriptional regulator